jgi:3-keto-disaccharide hydrolase
VSPEKESPVRPALRRITVAALAAVMLSPVAAWAQQPTRIPLESPAGLRLQNVSATPATWQGRKGLRVELSEETIRRLKAMTPAEQQQAVQQGLVEQFAVIEASDFGDGVIEAEIAGAPRPDAGEGARGFVGIAFRVQDDLKTYDAFYLRPTNGRADDQVRRNHSAQYISHPDWPWFRLRKEFPEKYEAYVDLVPGEWTKIRIEVQGERAKLFVHGLPQPTLIVNDVKSGAKGRGKVALWIDSGTVAHFRNLTVTPGPAR